MLVTIHQPDMLPWLGFFNKIYKADLWVILDHTKNNPRDANFWGRRVKILVNGKDEWLSLPLKKPLESGIIGIPVHDIEFSNVLPNVYYKALQTIKVNYENSPFFTEVFPIVEKFLLSSEMNMSKRNLSFIFEIMKIFEFKTKVCYSTDLNCQKASTPLLVEIIKKVNGTSYLCGGGASLYQVDDLFIQSGIQLIYNDFKHPVYNQFNSNHFTTGLSIIDALMNLGFDNTKKLVTN
jgi:hypothetical protein